MNPPNIILIILDTLRGDRVFEEDYLHLTPFMKALMEKSLIFKNCIANSPWTYPSHISMFTGLYHSQSTMLSKSIMDLSKKIPILTEILKKIGYFTTAYTENPYISKITGLTRGFNFVFNNYKDPTGWFIKRKRVELFLIKLEKFIERTIKYQPLVKLYKRIPFKILIDIIARSKIDFPLKSYFYKYKNNTKKKFRDFRNLLKKNKGVKPFYIVFNIMATHMPYAPEKCVLKHFQFTKREYSLISAIMYNNYLLRLNLNMNTHKLSNEASNALNKIYNASIYQSDLVVKRIFELINKLDLMDDAYIIITSDHGEHLCTDEDHLLWQHSTLQSVYRPVIKVPLMIFHPKFNTKLINEQVQLKDLFHTIIHMTGRKNQNLNIEYSLLYQIEHQSMPKYILGEYLKTEDYINDIIAVSNNYGKKMKEKYLNSKIEKDICFLRSNKYKYINFNNDIEEFYDIESDPYELRNIFNKNNEIYKEMKAYLENLLSNNKNINLLENVVTRKEKDTLKNIITKLKL
ncbi:MAG: sulfatase-like hydrolase/transferase [Promethearchaeota archaeon]